jgi:hypothetical protein
MLNRRTVLKAATVRISVAVSSNAEARVGALSRPGKDDGRPPRQFIITVAGGTVIESWKPEGRTAR